MSSFITFVIAVSCGMLGAQFLFQAITSLIIATIALWALVRSKVDRAYTFAGSMVSLVQTILYAALLYGVYWAIGRWLDPASLNLDSVVFWACAAFTALYCLGQIPGKIVLAKLSAWEVGFTEVMLRTPRNQRVALARGWPDSIKTAFASRQNS